MVIPLFTRRNSLRLAPDISGTAEVLGNFWGGVLGRGGLSDSILVWGGGGAKDGFSYSL